MDVPTSLAGYAMAGHGIAPAEHQLDLPGFWPAYLGPVRREFADEPELFGADAADLDAASEALYDATESWPAYRIPLWDGQILWVVHRNFPDDAGTDYLLTHPDRPRETHLASIDGHHTGPGLSWPDLLAAAEATPVAPVDAAGVCDPDQRLLLLLPAFGDADTPVEAAIRRISAALVAVGMAEAVAPEAAELLLDNPFRASPFWDAQGASPLSGGSGDLVPVRASAFSPPTDTP
jgi:hypothetical protein